MKRVFGDYAYGPGPREGCWWDQTCDIPDMPELGGTIRADVVVIGAGFTGLNAALTLAQGGAEVVVLEAEQPGFGASGRNGGFCCLGGGYANDAWLDKRFGTPERIAWRRAEVAAVAHVGDLIERHHWQVDRHSQGETLLAHCPMSLEDTAALENYGVSPEYVEQHDLRSEGFGGKFHGAMTMPIGFGLNPRKYLAGLLDAVLAAGVRVFGGTRALALAPDVTSANGRVIAERVILATNGYSSDDLPPWLNARVMPAQSNILVTRPLSPQELAAQGWNTDQMCFDTRNLLHYFRLLPDRRFLFGMRGGILSSARAEARARRAVRSSFERMFPAWSKVETQAAWSGMVAMAWGRMPFVGKLPDQERILAAMCFHGNGVAMGSYAGHLVGQLALGNANVPRVMQEPLARFPLGRYRRLLMPPIYAGLRLLDR